jgi:hypothetical protein
MPRSSSSVELSVMIYWQLTSDNFCIVQVVVCCIVMTVNDVPFKFCSEAGDCHNADVFEHRSVKRSCDF